jgi:hypothetical protein
MDIYSLKRKIIEVEKEILGVEKAINMILDSEAESFRPSIKDVERWMEYGYHDAIDIFEEQEGKWPFNEDGTIDRLTAMHKALDQEDFLRKYVMEMQYGDWIQFYEKLVRDKKRNLQGLTLELKELELELEPTEDLSKTKNDNRDKGLRAIELFEDELQKIRNGTYETSQEIINALQDIQTFEPIGEKEKVLFRADGTIIKDRLANIFKVIFDKRYDPETITESYIKKKLRFSKVLG